MTLVDWIVVTWILASGVGLAAMSLVARWYAQESARWHARWLEERQRARVQDGGAW